MMLQIPRLCSLFHFAASGSASAADVQAQANNSSHTGVNRRGCCCCFILCGCAGSIGDCTFFKPSPLGRKVRVRFRCRWRKLCLSTSSASLRSAPSPQGEGKGALPETLEETMTFSPHPLRSARHLPGKEKAIIKNVPLRCRRGTRCRDGSAQK